MSYLEKIKNNDVAPAAIAPASVEDLQIHNDLGRAYNELGRRTAGLINAGSLACPELDYHATQIRQLEETLTSQALGGPTHP